MTAEERIAQLESENAALRGENAALREERAILVQQLEHLLARLEEVAGRLTKDSHKSSKPPSSDGPARKRGSWRAKSGKQTGGQPGHAGRTMLQVAKPDEIVHHRPATCVHCQQSLEAVTGQLKERRQGQDLPAMRVVVQEHQVGQVLPSVSAPEHGKLSPRSRSRGAVWAEQSGRTRSAHGQSPAEDCGHLSQ